VDSVEGTAQVQRACAELAATLPAGSGDNSVRNNSQLHHFPSLSLQRNDFPTAAAAAAAFCY